MKIQKYIKYLIYRFKWHTAKYVNYSSPTHVDIELSTRCNLNCEFCFRQEYKYPAKDMDFNLVNNLLQQASELGIKSVKFNWRGESILHSEFKYFLSHAQYLGLYTMLNTSLAQDLSDEQLKAIAWFIDELDISIDSSQLVRYEKIRKGANFERTLDNLRILLKYRKQYNMPKIILNRRTSQMTESDKEFKDYFGKEFKYDIRPAMNRNQKKIYFEGLQKRERKYCAQSSRRMVVDVDGNVWTCCVAYTQEDALKLGNIKERSLRDCWDSAKRTALVKELKNNMFLNETCKNCTSGESYK